MNDNKKRDIFYGIVAVATLIVAMIGATLAYFSITGGSEEGAVNATAATVSIEYEDGSQISLQADELIPSAFDYVKAAYEKIKNNTAIDPDNPGDPKCIDSNGKQICSTYRFSINNADTRAIVATLNAEHNGFTTESLSFAVYDLVNNVWLDLQSSVGSQDTMQYITFTNACDNTNEDDTDDCYTITSGVKTYAQDATKSIFGTTNNGGTVTINSRNAATQRYEVVLFMLERNIDQNADQGKSFHGTIKVDLVNGSNQITGFVE